MPGAAHVVIAGIPKAALCSSGGVPERTSRTSRQSLVSQTSASVADLDRTPNGNLCRGVQNGRKQQLATAHAGAVDGDGHVLGIFEGDPRRNPHLPRNMQLMNRHMPALPTICLHLAKAGNLDAIRTCPHKPQEQPLRMSLTLPPATHKGTAHVQRPNHLQAPPQTCISQNLTGIRK